jgi:inorganic triphosphatase YgiF
MVRDVETELKLSLRREDLEFIRSSAFPDDLEIGPPTTETIVSTYFDTADGRLRENGLSLRLRRIDGCGEQTLKEGEGLARGEVTVEYTADRPDLAAFPRSELAARARKLVRKHALRPRFTVSVARTTRAVRSSAGDLIDLSVDLGELEADGRRLPISELELELKSGSPASLYDVARALVAGRAARPSPVSKAERGHRLLAGEGEGPTPAVAMEPDIPAEATVAEAAQALFRSCAAQILANVEAVEASDDTEGPHQLRVGLRRLRTGLRVFRPILDPAFVERLKSEARDLGRVVGRLRDLDVLAEDIVGVCSGHVDTTVLLAVLADQRAAERSALVKELAEPRTGAFLVDLSALAEGFAFARVEKSAAHLLSSGAGRFARDAIHRLWTKTARQGRNVDDLTPEQRHELRKSFKTLRYALDSVGPLINRKNLKHLLRGVRAAQEVLGYLNDVRNADALVGISGDTPRRTDRDVAASLDRSVGFCLGWHRAEAVRVWEEGKALVTLDPTAY